MSTICNIECIVSAHILYLYHSKSETNASEKKISNYITCQDDNNDITLETGNVL